MYDERLMATEKRALITGITGQDGSYLAELLLEQGYEVTGVVRRLSAPNFGRIEHLLDRITLRPADLLDQLSLVRIIQDVRPHEFYNLAAMSFVPASWDQPLLTGEYNSMGVTRLLDTKPDRFWPSIGELRGVIAGIQASRDGGKPRCQRCGGSTWVEARPYTANGGHVYQGVVRCPDCGVPPPVLHGASHQTPLSDRDYANWRAAQPPIEPLTREEFLSRIRALAPPAVVRALAGPPRTATETGSGATIGGLRVVRGGATRDRGPEGL